MREDVRDADEEISKLREDENKEAEHLCWIVVTPFGVGEYCYGESWCSDEAQGWRQGQEAFYHLFVWMERCQVDVFDWMFTQIIELEEYCYEASHDV